MVPSYLLRNLQTVLRTSHRNSEHAWFVNQVRPKPAGLKKSKTNQQEKIDMTKRILSTCTMLLLGVAATQAIASTDENHDLEGVWNVNVTIRQCQTGGVIRTVRALNLFMHDGSFTETGANILRSPSVGGWRHDQGKIYTATFWFFRS